MTKKFYIYSMLLVIKGWYIFRYFLLLFLTDKQNGWLGQSSPLVAMQDLTVIYPWDLKFQWCFIKIWEKNAEVQCCNWLNEHNHCLGWHLQSFRCNTNVSKILEYIILFYTLNRELFPMNWKNETFSVRNMTQFWL